MIAYAGILKTSKRMRINDDDELFCDDDVAIRAEQVTVSR